MKARRAIAWLSLLGAISLLPGSAWPTNASCGSAPQQLDDWETASPEDVGLDAAVLCKITQELAAQGGTAARPDRRNVHAVLVVRHGKLVFEAYAPGKDENWGEPLGIVPHDAATKHDVMSISKSVVSLLFGIALERKLIAGTDVPVMSFFSGVRGAEDAQVGQDPAAPSPQHDTRLRLERRYGLDGSLQYDTRDVRSRRPLSLHPRARGRP